MQRTKRTVSDAEKIDALNAIVDIIIDCYNKRLEDRFETRSTRIGKNIQSSLLNRKILERYSDIGWKSQRYLLEKNIIKTGGIMNEEEE